MKIDYIIISSGYEIRLKDAFENSNTDEQLIENLKKNYHGKNSNILDYHISEYDIETNSFIYCNGKYICIYDKDKVNEQINGNNEELQIVYNLIKKSNIQNKYGIVFSCSTTKYGVSITTTIGELRYHDHSTIDNLFDVFIVKNNGKKMMFFIIDNDMNY